MPKVSNFRVEILTGADGAPGPVKFDFNGHTMEFNDVQGSTAPGDTFKGSFDARSFAHSVALVGPPQGTWRIENMVVTYHSDGGDPYTVTFSGIDLDDASALDIWRDRPLPTFDV